MKHAAKRNLDGSYTYRGYEIYKYYNEWVVEHMRIGEPTLKHAKAEIDAKIAAKANITVK